MPVACEHENVAITDPDREIQKGVCKDCGVDLKRVNYDVRPDTWGISRESAEDLFGTFGEDGWSPWDEVKPE